VATKKKKSPFSKEKGEFKSFLVARKRISDEKGGEGVNFSTIKKRNPIRKREEKRSIFGPGRREGKKKEASS